MKLTALEIKQQSFERTLRGYDTTEVHSFLNLVASEWEHMTGKVRELEKQIDKLNEKLRHYERVEEALHETLQTAKDSAEQKMIGAKKESQNIIEKAEMEADSIILEANQRRQQIRQNILRLLDKREEITGSIQSYLDNARESIQQFSRDDHMTFSLPGEDDDEDSHMKDKKGHSTRPDTSPKKSSASAPDAEKVDDIIDEIE